MQAYKTVSSQQCQKVYSDHKRCSLRTHREWGELWCGCGLWAVLERVEGWSLAGESCRSRVRCKRRAGAGVPSAQLIRTRRRQRARAVWRTRIESQRGGRLVQVALRVWHAENPSQTIQWNVCTASHELLPDSVTLARSRALCRLLTRTWNIHKYL